MRTRPQYGLKLTWAVIASSLAHVLLLFSLITLPGIYIPFMDRPMKIDVMWVELPKGSSEDIGLGVKESKSLPQSTIEEQKKTFQPEKTQQQTLKPELKAPPTPPLETTVQKATKEKRPEIDTSKMVKSDDKAKTKMPVATTGNKKIRNALAMIDKELSGRQIVPEASQVGKSSDGYKYGTSDKPLKVAPSDPEYIKYQAMVRAKIIREWIVPTVYTSDGGKPLSVRLEVLINMDGEVVSTRLGRSSRNSSFDQSAMRAVKNASPFPKPPDRLAWEAYNEGFLVEFDPRLKPQ